MAQIGDYFARFGPSWEGFWEGFPAQWSAGMVNVVP